MRIAYYDKIMSLNDSIIMASDLNAKHTNWGGVLSTQMVPNYNHV